MKDFSGWDRLIRQTSSGNLSAFEELYDAIQHYIPRHLSRKFPSLPSEEIEDIAQYTSLQVYRNAARYRGPRGDPSAVKWISGIARHRAMHILETLEWIGGSLDEPRRSNDGENDAGLNSRVDMLRASENTEQDADRVICHANFQKYLQQRFGSRDAEIVRLRIDEYRTLEEIGKMMGISKVRVKQILDTIMKQARKDFEPEDLQ
jgi:RNA polymerase sigma factor (sigma-70 family)